MAFQACQDANCFESPGAISVREVNTGDDPCTGTQTVTQLAGSGNGPVVDGERLLFLGGSPTGPQIIEVGGRNKRHVDPGARPPLMP